MFNKTGFISFLCLILLQILCVGSFALSVRSIGMGDVYPPTGRDPSAIFYNPAYLANCDSIRLSLDNMNGPMDPKDNIALSMGEYRHCVFFAWEWLRFLSGNGHEHILFPAVGDWRKVL